MINNWMLLRKMRLFYSFVCVILSITLNCLLSNAQVPPRLNIPGALLVPQTRPVGFRQGRVHSDAGPPQRLRRPIPNAIPAPIRPVVEEPEEPAISNSDNFDEEVANLGISALQSAVRQAVGQEEEPTHTNVVFRPERPIPVLRQDVRENPVQRPPQAPIQRPLPVLRQEQRESFSRGAARQEIRDEAPVLRPQPIRHAQPRQQAPTPQPQQFRQQPRPAPRQPSQYVDDNEDRHSRTRKPVVQILRKYRTDNADGSITWGYENDDGSFKEETIGIDCITKGKYGYVDPDGLKKEYNYETGHKCDQKDLEEEAEEELRLQQPQSHARKPQPQFRPLPAQY